jgi:hypothetical protein
MPDTQKIGRLYCGRALRWLLIGCLFVVGVALFIWATFDESADWTATEDVIRGYRWQGLFFFALAIGLFVGVGWLVRFPSFFRRHRAFMKLLRAFCLVGLGFALGYSFGFYGGVSYIFRSRMDTIHNHRLMMDAVRNYTSTNQPVIKP